MILGSVFGLVSIFSTRSHRRQQFELLEGLSEAQCKVARRAATRGKVPDDIEVRTRAADLALLHWRQYQDGRTAAMVISGLLLLANIGIALTDSAWWWLTVPLIGASLVRHWLIPRRLGRRVELLSGDRGNWTVRT